MRRVQAAEGPSRLLQPALLPLSLTIITAISQLVCWHPHLRM